MGCLNEVPPPVRRSHRSPVPLSALPAIAIASLIFVLIHYHNIPTLGATKPKSQGTHECDFRDCKGRCFELNLPLNTVRIRRRDTFMDRTKLTSDLRKALEDQKEKMGTQNELQHRGAFISNDFLQQLFTAENIRSKLEIDQVTGSMQDPQALITFIKTRARKIFAILVLLDEGRRISNLQNSQPVVDDHLLFTKSCDDASKPYCSLEKLRRISALSDIAQKLYEEQWAFPAVLSPAVHLDFDPQYFRFPFKTKPAWIAAGASGQVHGVELAEGYLKDSAGSDINIKIVYKKIRNDAERQDDMDRIMKEVKFLRERRHPNISPLLASFTAGLESSTNAEPMTKCLYLLAPQAEMDMEKWFNKEPSYIKTFESYESQDFNQHIYAAMRGLISGLTYIHRQLGFYVGYHGDLKPKNILKFESQSKLAWKISDFGTSNLKPVDDTRTQNIETTPYWAPKEFMAAITQREDGNHGRSHDVWSLGCIFLLLATMLVHKWEPEGLKAFEDLRAKDAKDPLDHAFCNRMPQVRQWIAELRKKKPRTDFGQLLDLIEEMLQPREARIFSWEAAVDLSSISDPSRTSDEIVEHLQQVVQAAREADLKLGQHNPLTRARSDKRKKARYLEILMENGWYDGLTTEEEKRVAMAKRSVSTLPTLESGDHVVGIETVLKKISERFKETDSLALSGLAGVGKTIVALRYVKDINKQLQQDLPPIKDVFWVDTRNIDIFDRSYTAIAAKLKVDDPGFQRREDLWKFVKSHLEEKSTNKWLMVVDGFDHDRDTRIIEAFLPRRGSGKILITTRNTLLVKDLLDWRQRKACIEMEYPDNSTALSLLRTYIDEDIIEDTKYAKQILHQLNCPKMIRRLSRYMNDRNLTFREMYKVLKKRKYQEVERLLPDFAGYLLIPTLGASLLEENEWSDELRLLVLLCLFDNEIGVDTRLIHVEYDEEDHKHVDEWLQKLVACHFVRKQTPKSKGTIYLVNPTVHLAVLTWLETNEPPRRRLERYNKVLSMLFRSYDARKRAELKKRKDKPSRRGKSLDSFKVLLMPHFHQFVEYTKAAKEQIDFRLYDRAVQAVISFSDLLLHEDRYEDAIKVLEFTKMHFRLQDLHNSDKDKEKDQNQKIDVERKMIEEKKRRRDRSIYFQLNGLLTKTYLFRPKDELSLEYLEQAEKLVRKLQEEVASGDDTVVWAGRTLRAWNLAVDLVRVHWKSGEFVKAWTGFTDIRKVGVKFEGREAVLPQARGVSYDSKDKQELRKLAFRVKREESLLNLAHGDKLDYNNKQSKARGCWEAAHDACLEARSTVQQWFPTDKTLLSETDEDIVKIWLKLGGKDHLNKAENILKRVMHPADGEAGMGVDGKAIALDPSRQSLGIVSKRKELERRYLLNAIRLKRGESADPDDRIVNSLTRLVVDTRENLGNSDELTDTCDRLLVDAYKATGREQKALEHEQTFGKAYQFEKRSQWIRRLKRWGRENWVKSLGLVIFAAMAWLLSEWS